MKAKFVNEGLMDFLKPKTDSEIKSLLNNDVVNKISSIGIREDAIAYVAELIWEHNGGIGVDVKQEIIEYLSENEFNEALLYIIKDKLNMNESISKSKKLMKKK